MTGDQGHVNKLQEIRLSVLFIQETLKSANADEVIEVMREYAALVDRFYEVDVNLAPPQYTGAMKDFDYFIRLLDMAIAYHRDMKIDEIMY